MQQLVADFKSKAILVAKISLKYLSKVPNDKNVRINLMETSENWNFLDGNYWVYNVMSNQLTSTQFSEAKGTVVCFPAIDRIFPALLYHLERKKKKQISKPNQKMEP